MPSSAEVAFEPVLDHDRFVRAPIIGDRIELLRPRLGLRVRGTVFYSDHLQVLVKWDDGRSESLRSGTHMLRVLDD